MSLLIVEPDAPLASFLCKSFEAAGHQVRVAYRAGEAHQVMTEAAPELVVLDLDLSSGNATALLQQVRTRRPEARVLAVTSSQSIEQRIQALDGGADDCVVKPFWFAELAARVRALLRRAPPATQALLRVADLELDRMRRKVRRAGREVELTSKEFSLIEYLMLNAGHAVTRAMILDHVWNMALPNNTNVVDVYVNYLRKKLDGASSLKLIHTVRGVGYQLSAFPSGIKAGA